MDEVERTRATGARVEATLVAAAPTIAFLVADAVGTLPVAIGVAAATALAVFGWRLYRRARLGAALIGLVLVAACATVAAVTGQARGFFLIPALIPFGVIAVCVATVVIGRPLTGLLLNKVIGGPPRWWTHPRLRRVHVIATLTCAAVNVVNGALQVVFYQANQPLVLGALHIATGPVFAVIVAVTIGFARRYASAPVPVGG
jgi:hypothetical protein